MSFNKVEFDQIYRRFLELEGKRKHIAQGLDVKKTLFSSLETRYDRILKGREVIQVVATMTQKNLEKRVSSLVSMALDVVFPDDPYGFELEFVPRRNKTECDVWFTKRGKKMHPMGTSGGGPKDVASFAARLAFWSLDRKNNPRPVIIVDEPFKFLHSPAYQENCSNMINELSKDLGIQMILVTDQEDISGDRVFEVQGDGKVVVKGEK